MSEDITISLKVNDQFSRSLAEFRSLFESAFTNANKHLRDISNTLGDLSDSIKRIGRGFETELNNVDLSNLALEIAGITGSVLALHAQVDHTSSLLERLAARTIVVTIGLRVGWDVGTWINDNIVVPFQKWAGDRDRNDVHRLLEQVLTPTDALDKLNAIYRKAGDDAQKFAALGVGAFETLRSRVAKIDQGDELPIWTGFRFAARATIAATQPMGVAA